MGCGCNSNFSGQKNKRKGKYLNHNANIDHTHIDPVVVFGDDYYVDLPNVPNRDDFPKSKKTGQKKQCTCGRNAGGACQCNQRKVNASVNLQQRLKSNKAKFSSFMGSSQNYPQVDTKKYGISDEHYYEFNSPSNVRTGINYNDIDVSF